MNDWHVSINKSLRRLVNNALGDFRNLRNSLTSRPEGPWLSFVIVADFLSFESLKFSNTNWWYGNFLISLPTKQPNLIKFVSYWHDTTFRFFSKTSSRKFFQLISETVPDSFCFCSTHTFLHSLTRNLCPNLSIFITVLPLFVTCCVLHGSFSCLRSGSTIVKNIAAFALELLKVVDKLSSKVSVNLKPLLFIGRVKRIVFLWTNCLQILLGTLFASIEDKLVSNGFETGVTVKSVQIWPWCQN